jgi:broad specificity phosphatase PhoE
MSEPETSSLKISMCWNECSILNKKIFTMANTKEKQTIRLTLYFLRHGETTASRAGGYCGTLDPDLTPEGCRMAEDFADSYKILPWVAVFCSPTRRTIATAGPLCTATGIELQQRKGLREIAYGQWEGKTPAEVNREFHDNSLRWQADPGWNAPTGGERGIDVARRSSLVLEEIEQTCRTGNVLVVSHKATTRIMLCSLLGIDVGRYRDRLSMPVASISIVEMTANGPLLHVMGDRSYLREDLRKRAGT